MKQNKLIFLGCLLWIIIGAIAYGVYRFVIWII